MPKSLEQFDMNQNISSEKEEKLSHIYEGLKKYEDESFGIDSGIGIDASIKDTVAYLNAFDFNTVESCSGHLTHGSLSPRVAIEASEKPKWRFIGQKEVFEKVALKHRVTLEEVFEHTKPKYDLSLEDRDVQPKNAEQIGAVWDEGWDSTPKEEETEEFKLWRKKTDELAGQLDSLTQEFYEGRSVEGENSKLVVEKHDDPELPHVYNYFLHNGGEDYLVMVDPGERAKLSEEEMNVLKKRLEANQKEMKDFTEFLKEKYNSH